MHSVTVLRKYGAQFTLGSSAENMATKNLIAVFCG